MSTDSRVKKRADAAGNVDKSRKRKVKLPVIKDKKHKKDKKHAGAHKKDQKIRARSGLGPTYGPIWALMGPPGQVLEKA